MRWEYLTRTKGQPLAVNELAELGAEGWELCGCMFSTSRPTWDSQAFHYVFKRPVKTVTGLVEG